MEDCLNYWKKENIYSQLKKLNYVLCKEPNNDKKCKKKWEKYVTAFAKYKKLHSGNIAPGMFLAYIRGRLSEGIDFKDELARVVVIVGVPNINKE